MFSFLAEPEMKNVLDFGMKILNLDVKYRLLLPEVIEELEESKN